MKCILIIMVFVNLFIDSFSYDWAPVGAKWYYGEGFQMSLDANYVLYTSEKDTVVKGQSCRKISKNHDFFCQGRPNFELMFSINDSVYFYDNRLDTFQMLYNFRALKNDSWSFKFKDIYSGVIETINIHVDSTSNIFANSTTLKLLYITYTTKFGDNLHQYQSKIIEKIGDVSYMINFLPSVDLACDMNYSSGIRCYEDDIMGNYHFPEQDSCTHVYKWTDLKYSMKQKITLYPNPSNDFIQLKGLDQTVYFKIYDINGKLVMSDIIKGSQIVINELSKGFYTILITDKNKEVLLREKIVKE